MKYGCIGERLGHSFSREIHKMLDTHEYELCEIKPENLGAFIKEGDFSAINVTIPYKERVIPYLYYTDPVASEIGAVNTVVNRQGRLYGYNTDFYGLSSLIKRADVEIEGKKVLILGTGGTSRTAYAVAKAMGACQIIKVSRSKGEGAVSYGEAESEHGDADVLINTTPVGMYPNDDGIPLNLDRFTRLSGVIDAVYNPLRTSLVTQARRRGVKAKGGLYMLVAQAVRASEIFADTTYPDGTVDRIYAKVKRDKENIVLTGMPTSGKSTVGKLLAESLGRTLIDSDSEIERAVGKTPAEIINSMGEAAFRQIESEIIAKIAKENGKIIATGGGVVLNEANVDRLSRNGRIYFLDRPCELLIPTSDRPLSSDRESIIQRYRERYPTYASRSDVRIDASGTALDAVRQITEEFTK